MEAWICRAVGIFFRSLGQKALYRILPDVIFELLVFERISDPPVHEAWLPYVSFGFQVFIELERESSLDQLHGPFQRDSCWGNDQMEMVRHDNKLMQKILFLCSVVQHDFNEEPGNLLHLEKALSLKHIGRDKVGGFSCSSSMRNRQKSPQRLKPNFKQLCRRTKVLLHPVGPKTIAVPAPSRGCGKQEFTPSIKPESVRGLLRQKVVLHLWAASQPLPLARKRFNRAYEAGTFRSLTNREFIDFLEALQGMPWSWRNIKTQGGEVTVPLTVNAE